MDLRQIVQEEIALAKQKAGYNPTLVPFHTHNGKDSPRFSILNLLGLYTGYVTGATTGYLPPGWSVSSPTAGNYVIVHNLGTTNYVPIVTVNGGTYPATSAWAGVQSFGVNSFNVNTGKYAVGDTNYNFWFAVFVNPLVR